MEHIKRKKHIRRGEKECVEHNGALFLGQKVKFIEGGATMKVKSKQIVLAALLVFVLVFFFSVDFASAQKTIKLKYAITHGSPGLNPMADQSVIWQEEVTRRSNGAITFENYWAGALGAPAEHIELLKNGVIDAGIIFGWYTPTKLPFSNFEYVFPFHPVSYEIVVKAKKQIRAEIPEFNKEFAQQNAMVLADLPQTTYTFISKEPLRTLDDFKGKKVGLIGRYFGRWLPPGATAVVRPGHDRYDMLKTGVTTIDFNPLENMYLFKLNEVTSYCMTGVELITLANTPICMNIDSFKKLSPEHQKIVLEAGRYSEERAWKDVLPNWEKKILGEFKAKGMKFVEFPKSEVQKWAASLEDIPTEWAAEMESKGLPGFQTVKRWQEITSEMGFKWPRQWGVKR